MSSTPNTTKAIATSVGSVQDKLNELQNAVSRLENLPAELLETFAPVSAPPCVDCAIGEAEPSGNSDIARALDHMTVRVDRVIGRLVEVKELARLS